MNIFERILNYEEKNNLFDLSYNGMHFWPIIRLNFWLSIIFNGEVSHPDHHLKTKKKHFNMLSAALQQCFYKPSSKDLLVSVPSSLKEFNGELLNPFDYFLQNMSDISIQKFTVYTDWSTLRLSDEKNNAILETLLLPTKIHSKLFEQQNPDFIQIIDDIDQAFDVQLDAQAYAQYIMRVCSIIPKIQK